MLTNRSDVLLDNKWRESLILNVARQSADLILIDSEFEKLAEETQKELKYTEVLHPGM